MFASTMKDPTGKYSPYKALVLPQRTWPAKTITQAPIWCSVDLKDGNQGLPVPMTQEEKLEYLQLLVALGFKEIEIGAPALNDNDLTFLNSCLRDGLIPPDVAVQVMCSADEADIKNTLISLKGFSRAIIHFCLPQAQKVQDKLGQLEIALNTSFAPYGEILQTVTDLTEAGLELTFLFSVEHFNELDKAASLQSIENILDILGATKEKPVTINLAATVERSLPNQFADEVEWLIQNLKAPDRSIISVHLHNDRGTAVAASELALLAGAGRIEGTLFGNGGRAGNGDILTLALNLYTQGIDPLLNFSNLNLVKAYYQKYTHLAINPRHPYAGDLVYTALAPAQEEAVLLYLSQKKKGSSKWQVPYLSLDPGDVGLSYEPTLRSNTSSLRASAAFILENTFGYKLPKAMAGELGEILKNTADYLQEEISSNSLLALFEKEFVKVTSPYELKTFCTVYLNEDDEEDNEVSFSGIINYQGEAKEVTGKGNGPIDALFAALKSLGVSDYDFLSYDQHALSTGSDSRAVAYIQLGNKEGQKAFGVGTSRDIRKASLRALISAVNRFAQKES